MPVAPRPPSPEPQRLESVDALRGLAFLAVLLVHASQAVPPFPGRALAGAGAYGVTLFFIASAFTLYASQQQRRTAESAPVTAFFIRRIFRIVPLFWAGIAFYYVIYGTWNRTWAEGTLGLFHFGLTATLLHGWHPDTINSVVPGGWSIAAEFGFYVLAPLLFLVITSWRRAVCAYVIALGIALTLNAIARDGLVARLFPEVPAWRQGSFSYLWLPAHLPTFLLGFLVYHLRAPFEKLSLRVRSSALAIVCALIVISAFFLRGGLADFLFPAVLAGLVLTLVARPIPVLVNRFTCTLGTLSFSAYITHFAALRVMEKIATRVPLSPAVTFCALFVGGLILTTVISWITYRTIELPGIAIGRKLTRALQPKPVHSVAVAHAN